MSSGFAKYMAENMPDVLAQEFRDAAEGFQREYQYSPRYFYGEGVAEPFPQNFEMTIEEATKTYPMEKRPTARQLEASGHRRQCKIDISRAIGEVCYRLFSYRGSHHLEWRKLSSELKTIDYSPVMSYFAERGVRCVEYEPREDAFYFTFNHGPDGLVYFRGSTLRSTGFVRWAKLHNNPSLGKASGLSTAGMNSVTTLNCPNCIGVVESLDRYCRHCSYILYPSYPQAPPTPKVAQGGPLTGSYGVGPAIGGPTATSHFGDVTMRCPGGCGSEIVAGPAFPTDDDPFRSSCTYRCKVRVAAWNKKYEEAKKNQRNL